MITLFKPDVATFINVFTIDPSQQNILAHRIKSDAETLISRQAGFIKAIVYRSLDGSKVINVVQWESVEASRAIHHNPEVAAGFARYQELDVQMDLRYYEIAFTIEQPFTIQDHDRLVAQIDVLHLAPSHQKNLLKKLTQHSMGAIAPEEDNPSIIWLRSLDGLRVIRFCYSQKSNHGENAKSNFVGFANENWIEKVNSNHYQIECVVTSPGLLV